MSSPTDDLDIFEPFATTQSRGTGLGLLIVRCIVEAHGGTIGTENEKRGAYFLIRLPIEYSSQTETDK
ncbi:MAG: ATP-binding protein [Planctomycetota bacterium]|nr:ATP-binding protein [Planctomycetota bacterium]MDA1139794.1 ATP-binding protein [Planctomycetota bacterium]